MHRSSEYHERAAWRARGLPVAVTEARAQYSIWQFFLSLTGERRTRGLIIPSPPQTILLAPAALSHPLPTSAGMLLFSCPAQELISHLTMTGHIDRRI